jgi:hypothetical protein
MTVVRVALTIGLVPARVAVLDTLRRQRNLSDYTGDDVDDSSAENCIVDAERQLKDVISWLKENHPELIVA